MNNRKWREAAQRTITAALTDVTTKDETELRRILFDAYPFGERDYTPYKVWLEEVRYAIDQRLHPHCVTLTVRASSRDLEKLDAWNRASFVNAQNNRVRHA